MSTPTTQEAKEKYGLYKEGSVPDTERRWRVGTHYGIHVYEGDRPVATFHRAEDAALCVASLAAGVELRGEVERLTAWNERLRLVVQHHHDWHLAQEEDADGVGGAEAYVESGLCDRTLAALAAHPAPDTDKRAAEDDAYREGVEDAVKKAENGEWIATGYGRSCAARIAAAIRSLPADRRAAREASKAEEPPPIIDETNPKCPWCETHCGDNMCPKWETKEEDNGS